ncbi:MAG TPA: hypothetical protein VFE84_12980, partial [Patescibacteria group bacterium]|nr:hypothetical protein [Patescibacteria group bacterium]
PRAQQDLCWQALVTERRLPTEPGATQIRRARLLLVPFWRLVDESRRSLTRPGEVVSAADLSPVGLPCLNSRRRRIPGLDVEPRTRVGDAMGRLEGDPAALQAEVVDVMIGPDGGSPRAALDKLASESGAAARPWWQLVYYPVWSFHYILFNKEQYHIVDAVTARPVGPARRVRWALVVLGAIAPMLGVFVALAPIAGAAAALPAWLAGLVTMRLVLRSQRGG